MQQYPFEYRTYRYNRDQLKPGVVHLGFGNFARSFIADILDDVAEKGFTDLGLVAVAPSNRQARDFATLAVQDNIYHLLRQNKREICQRIGVLLYTIIGTARNTEVVDALSSPATRIATLTLSTEGYFPDNPKKQETRNIQNNDLAALRKKEWEKIQTPAGWVVAALYRRFSAQREPFVVLSCDNFVYNGEKTRSLIQYLAEMTGDSKFVDYIQTRVAFPNTVVDRITPEQNYGAQATHLEKKAGPRATIHTTDGPVADKCPIISEDYRELVVENHPLFPESLKTAFAKANVKFVDRIQAYQDRKLRILNGGHMIIGIAGKIMQIGNVGQAMEDRDLRTLFDQLLNQAAASLVPGQPDGEDMHAFHSEAVKRLTNPHLPDHVDRLVSSTHSKIHARFLNAEAIENPGFQYDASAFAIAAWIRYLQGRDDSGNPYSLDPGDSGVAERLGLNNTHHQAFHNNLCRFLTEKNLIDTSPAWQDFIARIVEDLHLTEEVGLRAAIQSRYPQRPATIYPLQAAPELLDHYDRVAG